MQKLKKQHAKQVSKMKAGSRNNANKRTPIRPTSPPKKSEKNLEEAIKKMKKVENKLKAKKQAKTVMLINSVPVKPVEKTAPKKKSPVKKGKKVAPPKKRMEKVIMIGNMTIAHKDLPPKLKKSMANLYKNVLEEMKKKHAAKVLKKTLKKPVPRKK